MAHKHSGFGQLRENGSGCFKGLLLERRRHLLSEIHEENIYRRDAGYLDSDKDFGETMTLEKPTGRIITGDCLAVMPTMGENSVDAIICDPPYGLSFMGKNWDHGVPGIPYWTETLRVAKPGAYLLAFGGTRTFHRLMCAIEDAGWEIRDTIMWVYGSGFPKSLNVGKAVDKLQGNERAVVSHYVAPDGQWRDCNNHKPNEEIRNPETHYGYKTSGFRPIDKGDSAWEGWGTALKPAWEPIVVARKPVEGTVAENVLKYGTGGINIDGCRVEVAENDRHEYGVSGDENPKYSPAYGEYGRVEYLQHKQGRFPANLIHDGSDEVMAVFPKTQPSKGGYIRKTGEKQFLGLMGDGSINPPDGLCDSGSAARFFYRAKASKQDRDEGCEGIELRQQDEGRKEGNPGGDNPRKRGVHKVKNNHPTVKPTALMRYLCRLVTQPGGIILDPFCGSGSTGKAAILEGFRFIGIEKESEYVEIAEKRIKHAVEEYKRRTAQRCLIT